MSNAQAIPSLRVSSRWMSTIAPSQSVSPRNSVNSGARDSSDAGPSVISRSGGTKAIHGPSSRRTNTYDNTAHADMNNKLIAVYGTDVLIPTTAKIAR